MARLRFHLLLLMLASAAAADAARTGAGPATTGDADSSGAAEQAGKAAASEKPPELALLCNSSGICEPCGAQRLNEHCRASGGFELISCVVVRATATAGAEQFTRPLAPSAAHHHAATLEEGSVVTSHRGCTPSSRLSVAGLMGICLALLLASLLALRVRERRALAF